MQILFWFLYFFYFILSYFVYITLFQYIQIALCLLSFFILHFVYILETDTLLYDKTSHTMHPGQ